MNAETPPAEPAARRPRRRLLVAFGVGALIAAVTAALAIALLVRVFEHKQEARSPFFRVVELDDSITDPTVWAQNFPHQYDSYARTVDQVRTRHGGSEAMPRAPTDADPRSTVTQSKLAEDPRLVALWRGYAFAQDFREERGHAYMLADQMFTGRHAVAQPGACLNCHASVVETYRELGDGDVEAGFHALNRMPYVEAREHVAHPVACIDCHDPATMKLRITRPAFVAGIAALKAAQGVAGYDVHTQATRQEMRSYVCAQCHVEYYFAGADKTLTYPWRRGARADEILAYYDEIGHKDWTHATTGAAALKAQHPEFEMWSQGTHARAGVACADCHMPYQRVGAAKVSSHHVRSPMLDINAACQTCHKASEDALRERVETIQGRHLELRELAEGQQPPRPQPDARHQRRLSDLSQGVRGRAARARRDDPGPPPRAARAGDAGGGPADRRDRGRAGDRAGRRAAPRRRARVPAPGAVPARLRRGRELRRLPRPARGGPRAGDVRRPRAPRARRPVGARGLTALAVAAPARAGGDGAPTKAVPKVM